MVGQRLGSESIRYREYCLHSVVRGSWVRTPHMIPSKILMKTDDTPNISSVRRWSVAVKLLDRVGDDTRA